MTPAEAAQRVAALRAWLAETTGQAGVDTLAVLVANKGAEFTARHDSFIRGRAAQETGRADRPGPRCAGPPPRRTAAARVNLTRANN